MVPLFCINYCNKFNNYVCLLLVSSSIITIESHSCNPDHMTVIYGSFATSDVLSDISQAPVFRTRVAHVYQWLPMSR